MVLNQTQSPVFQDMMGRLVADLGPCLLYTGTPFPNPRPGLTVERGPAYDRRSLLRRGWSWLRYSLGAAWRLLTAPRERAALVVTNPPLLPFLAWVACLVRGRRFAVLVWDLYPEHLTAIGWLRPGNLIVRAWRYVNQRIYLRASAVITIGERIADCLSKTVEGRRAIAVIPNWADTEWLKPVPKATNTFAARWRQQDKITIMYSGNIGATHGAETLADVASEFESDSRVSFLVVGDGLGRAPLVARASALGLKNITFLDYQPWETLPESLACADIALVLQDPVSALYSVPSKTYSFLATGAALLAVTSANSDLHDLVVRHGVGAVATAPSAVAIGHALRTLVSDPTALAGARRRARETAQQIFSCTTIHSQFTSALQPLT